MFEYVNIGVILTIFIRLPLTYGTSLSVKEEQDAGTFVGIVNGVNDDYTLTPTPYYEFFELTGSILSTRVRIDRERLSNDVIQLAAMSNKEGTAPVEFSVTVLDINDNDPQFPKPAVRLNLPELGGPQSKHIIPFAEDRDSGMNADIRNYSIISGDSELFRLSLESSFLYLVRLKPIDREKQSRYDLNISAADEGTPPRKGYLHVIVNVVDANDNKPKFTQKEYNYEVPENTRVGDFLFSVEAEDEDAGENARLSYELVSQPEPGTFTVNSTTGEIFLAKELDHETRTEHTLTMAVTDGGDPSMSDDALVHVKVTDVNDNDPVILFKYPHRASVASIEENESVGTRIAYISVKDPDSAGSGNAVKMTIESGNELQIFALEYIIKTLSSLTVVKNESLNQQPFYNLTIKAWDPDYPTSQRFSLASMIVVVNSGENHPPVFNQKIYNVMISETLPLNSVVVAVHATDNDAGLNGRLTYSIAQGNHLDWFSIDINTGLITTAKTLHFEQAPANGTITLRISAKDETKSALSDDATVEISIRDENDNSPVFSMARYSFNIAENQVGTLGNIEATDKDFGLNGDIQYDIESAACVSGRLKNAIIKESPFEIQFAGNIKVTEGLDRESCAGYMVQASAADMGSPQRKTTTEIVIYVNDVNDNAPTLYPLRYFTQITPDASTGAILARLMAHDDDSSDQNTLTYHMNAASRLFAVAEDSGVVTLSQEVNGRDGENHTAEFYAKDSAGHTTRQTAILTVLIISDPNSVASFTKMEYNFYAQEDIQNGFNVGLVELENNQQVEATFHITQGNQDFAFGINAAGIIYSANCTYLDAEIAVLRNLTVVAELRDTDTGKGVGLITTTCLVHVADVNDNYPAFVSLPKSARQITHNSYQDEVTVIVSGDHEKTSIYNAKVNDDDVTSRDADMSYQIYSSFMGFEVNPSSGVLYYDGAQANEESKSDKIEAEIEIMACDGKISPKCAAIKLIVTILFAKHIISHPTENMFMEISEKTVVGSQVGYAPAMTYLKRIRDSIDIAYDLNTASPFKIYPMGEIIMADNVDFEKLPGYQMPLTTKIQLGDTTHYKQSWLTGIVVDANDNAPVASQEEFRFSVKENAMVGVYVGTVTAYDIDSGIYGAVTYEIQKSTGRSVSDLFYCDRYSGDIYLTQRPDREILRLLNHRSNEANLVIIASDQNGRNSTSSEYRQTIVNANVTIELENRRPLHFQSTTYHASVPENHYLSNIVKVQAFDADQLWVANPKVVHYGLQVAGTKQESAHFVIGKETGLVGLKEYVLLDREAQDFHHLVLQAKYQDGSEIALSELYITVLDVKDAPPVFTAGFYEFSVHEQTMSRSPIGRVEAHDGDATSETTRITYEIGSGAGETFEIDHDSGLIISRELTSNHTLEVVASDESGAETSVTVKINVIKRKVIPELKYSVLKHFAEGYYSNRHRIAEVNNMPADDALQFTLISPSGPARAGYPAFYVDSTTGEVYVTGDVDREVSDTLKITVRVTASGTTEFRDHDILVDVHDVNDNAPYFTSRSSYVLSLEFAEQIGEPVTRITADDKDAGLNGIVSIKFSNTGESDFNLDGDGYLTIRSVIDTSNPVHAVDVTASDEGSPPKTTSATIYVIFRYDASSMLSLNLPKVHLTETKAKGSRIATVPGSAETTGSTKFYMGEVSSFSGDRDANELFSIDQDSGIIVTQASLVDFYGQYKLNVVTVEELPRNRQTRISAQTMLVDISDENNNPPEFPDSSMRFPASESLVAGTIVTTVKATDRDTDDVLTYSLSLKNGDLGSDFVIDSATATISVGPSGLDRERKSEYQLEVTADDGKHRSTMELWIDIEDVNDEAPQFPSTPICFDLPENSPVGTFVGHVDVIDPDLNSFVEYSIIDDNEPDTANFSIHGKYGTITYTGTAGLNRELQDFYVLHVKAGDPGGMSSEGRVHIYITDANNHQPVLQVKGEDMIEISEHAPLESVVALIEGIDDDLGLNQEIYYSIISGDPYKHFQIDSHSGKIRTHALLNREDINQYNLTVMGRNKYAGNGFEQMSTVSLSISLLDENDYKPYFTTDLIVYLEEDATNGAIVSDIKAVDPDIELGGRIRFRLESQLPSEGTFSIDADSGRLTIANNRNLDYERTKQYNLTIDVRDRGNPVLISKARIAIRIVDVNDNAPKFRMPHYSARLDEDALVGSHIIQVEADDLDIGYNSQIQYRIVPSANASFFYINRYSGDITLFNMLDYEKQQMISVEIEAIDGGAKPLTAFCTLVLYVNDVNDHSPVISPNHVIVHVPENTLSSALAKFTVTDEDSGSNGLAAINSIQPRSDFFDLLTNSDGSTSLVLQRPLNREVTKEYQLTIMARDRGYPAKKGLSTVLVIVDDRNEFAPAFDQFNYFTSIPEDANPGTYVTSVKATDDDGSGILYYLPNDTSLPFFIDHDNGSIYVREYLDREKMAQYQISVIAQDNEDEEGTQHRKSVDLVIDVTDVNDNTPAFTNGDLNIFVDSSNSVDTVAVVEAVDADSGENGRVTYSIVGAKADFSIDAATGAIRCLSQLKSSHNLTIQATDNSVEQKFTARHLQFYLVDARKPVISHDLLSTTLTLTENVKQNTVIGNFQASTLRGSVQFQLRGDKDGWFTLDRTTGKLTITGDIDRELASSVTLWVEAKDSGIPALSSFEKLTVNIQDANDNRPVFTNKIFTKHVREDEKIVITRFLADDKDEGKNGEVSYSIVASLSENAEKFSLFPNGDLTNVVRLDREAKSSYKLVIRATDQGTTALHTDIVFRVIVDDVNEHEPKFDRLLTTSIMEDTLVGTVILKVSSIDDDEYSNHTFRFTQNPGDYFNIDQSGCITVAKQLDRETLETHALEVEASDGIWSKSASVTIHLQDVNDNPPRFAQDHYKASISVIAALGSNVIHVNATDLDLGNNAKVNYEISGGSSYFEIDKDGQITTVHDLICRSQGCPVTHRLSIIACDSGTPSLQCGRTDVVISVKSVNDHVPQFVNKNRKMAVVRTTPINTKIIELHATDDDVGTIVTYTIVSGSHANYFSIADDDWLVLAESLASVVGGQQLAVIVEASDDGVPMKSTQWEFQFIVTEENPASPNFLEISYESNPILENSTVGMNVIRVQALDSDAGLNELITYQIVSGNEEDKFIIDEASGLISLDKQLDYEVTTLYELVVKATLSAVNPVEDTVTVAIPVQDVNDNVPYFNSSAYDIRVFEDTEVGTTVSRIYAIDDDSGSNAVIHYSIDKPTVINVKSSADIYLNSVIDYENQTFHRSQIFASNNGAERSEAMISMYVLGRNEYPPVFAQAENNFKIPYLAGYGSHIATLKATDSDGGVDGIVEYILIPSIDSKRFHLNKKTGKFIVLDVSSYEVGDEITLTVIAKNPTTTSEYCLFDEKSITIQVISNECHKNPCKNGASCEDGPSRFICYCLPGFTGERCGINIDDCKPNPCVHGTCADGVNEYQCGCDAGFTGKNCDDKIDFCESSPCLHGGKCTSEKTTFVCECPFGTKGDRCEIQSLNFPAQSYLVLPAFSTEISFEFSTVFPSALLFYSDVKSSKYVILEILNGKLQLKVKQGGLSELLLMNLTATVNDGTWHTVTVKNEGKNLKILLDGCTTLGIECAAQVDLDTNLDITSSDLTIGGIQGIDILHEGKLSSHDFVGCMRSLTFDTNVVSSSSSPNIKRKHLIKDGCVKESEQSACSSHTCQNEGSCTDLWTRAICTCPDGWQGPNCESKMNGHTFTGQGYASITFTDSFILDAVLESSRPSTRAKRSVGTTESSVEIRFRTLKNSGVLFTANATDNRHYGALYISAGQLHYQHISSDGLVLLSSTNTISDGLWHNVKVTIVTTDSENAEAILQLDDKEVVRNGRKAFPTLNQFGSVVITNFYDPLQVKTIYIGGASSALESILPSTESFKGCMFHFKLNGIRQQLRSDVSTSLVSLTIDNSTITQSCDGSGLACGLVTCENGRNCVPNSLTVSECVCSDGFSDNGETCAAAATGFSWWIIIIALIAIASLTAIAFFIYRRRKAMKETEDFPIENGISSTEYDVSAATTKASTPDIVPHDVEVLADDNPVITVSSCDEASNHTFSSQVTLIPTGKSITRNSYANNNERYHALAETGILSGRKSANDLLKNENSMAYSIQRPASAQANLVPEGLYTTIDRTRVDGPKLYTTASRTLPRKAPNKNMSYLKDHTDTAPRRQSSRVRNTSGTRTTTERKRQKRQSREVETLEIMMQELSGLAGLTKEEMDLLHAGALAIQKNNPEILYEDVSSASTSSATDSSGRSKNSNTSRRSRNTMKSATPRIDILTRNTTPSPALLSHRLDSKNSNLTERYVSLSPFNFPSPMFDSDTEDPNSTSPDDDTYESITSDDMSSSVTKQDSSSVCSSNITCVSDTNPLDLNFPSNLSEYFSTLTNVFDDISRLKSDESKRIVLPPGDPSRRPSILPGFVRNEISLWSEIEALSKKPCRQIEAISIVEGSTPTLPNGFHNDLRSTPINIGNRMNSPIIHDVIKEETLSLGTESRSSRVKSPIDLLESVEQELEHHKKKHNISRSSSGRSNRSLKTKAEFVKYV